MTEHEDDIPGDKSYDGVHEDRLSLLGDDGGSMACGSRVGIDDAYCDGLVSRSESYFVLVSLVERN